MYKSPAAMPIIKCRACMLTLEVGNLYYNLQNKLFYELYSQCIGIKIKFHKDHAGALCEECFQFCIKIKKFKAKCIVSEKLFEKEISKQDIRSFNIARCLDSEELNENPGADIYYIVDVIDSLDESIQKTYKDNKIRITAPNDKNYFTNCRPDLNKRNVTEVHENDEDSLESVENKFDDDDNDDNGNDMDRVEINSNVRFISDNLQKDDMEKTTDGNKINLSYQKGSDDEDFEWPQEISDDVLFARQPYEVPKTEKSKSGYAPCVECGKLLLLSEEREHYARWPKNIASILETPYLCCEHCKTFSTYNKCAFKYHIRTKHEQGQMCSICGLFFVKGTAHEKSHFQELVQCTFCNKSMYERQLARHMALHRGREKEKKKPIFFCDICKKNVETYKRKRHLELHQGIKRHKCTYCNRAFHSEFDLNDHVDLHTHELRFSCQFCGEKMTRMQRRFHEKKCDKRDPNKHSRRPNKVLPINLLVENKQNESDLYYVDLIKTVEHNENTVDLKTEGGEGNDISDIDDELIESILMDEE